MASCILRIGALDSSGVLLSYPLMSLASHTTLILICPPKHTYLYFSTADVEEGNSKVKKLEFEIEHNHAYLSLFFSRKVGVKRWIGVLKLLTSLSLAALTIIILYVKYKYLLRLRGYCSILLLSYSISSGVLGSPDLLLSYSMIALALHNNIILIITNPYLTSFKT